TVSLGNTADFGGTESSGNVDIGGSIDAPGVPNLGESFGKSVDPSSVNIETEDDELIDPVDVTYTFKADLTQWNPDEEVQNPEDWTLGQNVVIHDTLPSQLEWNTSAEDFIDAGDFELTEAIDFDGSAADFAANSYVGQYAVIGQDLYINVGQDQ